MHSRSSLSKLILEGSPEAIAKLLKEQPNLKDQADDLGLYPVHECIDCMRFELLHLFKDAGASLNVRTSLKFHFFLYKAYLMVNNRFIAAGNENVIHRLIGLASSSYSPDAPNGGIDDHLKGLTMCVEAGVTIQDKCGSGETVCLPMFSSFQCLSFRLLASSSCVPFWACGNG